MSDDEIQAIENRLNNRPRKVLQYKTPFEVFFAGLNPSSTVALHCWNGDGDFIHEAQDMYAR